MNKGSMIWAAPLVAFLLGSAGCTNTVRYMTTVRWMSVPGGATAPTTPSAPGTPAAPTGPAVAVDGARTLYVTFWEGTCSSGLFGFGKGCSIGDSKIRRCNVQADNAMACVDEQEANQAFARKK